MIHGGKLSGPYRGHLFTHLNITLNSKQRFPMEKSNTQLRCECGSYDLSSCALEHQPNGFEEEITCFDCGACWTEVSKIDNET